MRFNAAMCNIMRVSRIRDAILFNYSLTGQVLEEVMDAKYLGVTLSNDLEWSKHIATMTNKANSKLLFLCRNLKGCPEKLQLERNPKILVVIVDPSLFFHKHYNYMADRIEKRNNMLKAVVGSSWGQDKETLLLTYNALGKSIVSYAAPVWSTKSSDTSFKKIQTAQNAALRTATDVHKMASIDHLHQESLTPNKSQGPLRHALCAVPCELSGGGIITQ